MANLGLKSKVGVLGGGQLGKMFAAQAHRYGVDVSVLAANPNDPCCHSCDKVYIGDLMDFEQVYYFGKKLDVLTIEIEHVNTDALKKLADEGVKVYPQPAVIATVQNKGTQKDFYKAHGIATSAYQRFKDIDSLKASRPAFPFVWKATSFGYDGNGVKVVRNQEDLNALPGGACIAETMEDIALELSVIVARNDKGAVRAYPPVEMVFHPEANQVEYVMVPARISEELAQKANALALQVADAFQVVGLLAVELFLTKAERLLVNEVAPRTHNSGHYTIENAYTSQFEQQLRAILSLPLGNPANKQAAVMVNLVGAAGHQGSVYYKNMNQVMAMDGVAAHIYGKKQTRPFRKMGHITVVNDSLAKAYDLAKAVKKQVEVIAR